MVGFLFMQPLDSMLDIGARYITVLKCGANPPLRLAREDGSEGLPRINGFYAALDWTGLATRFVAVQM
jgi:hypothetical protein